MINPTVIQNLLHIPDDVPLSPEKMAQSLRVTFYPPHETTERLSDFSESLAAVLRACGVEVIPFPASLDPETGKVKPGIIIIEQGKAEDDRLAIHRVTGLYQNPLVAIYEGPPPVAPSASLQATLDAIVGVLAWNMTHIPVFVEADRWTICTMNGAVIRCGAREQMHQDVMQSLVPKLAAQVIPPKRAELVFREGRLDVEDGAYEAYVEDFIRSGQIWKQNRLMLSHTSVDALSYRSPLYRRIVTAYLDHRTGMSYGFIARQLPTPVRPALVDRNASDALRGVYWNGHATQEVAGETYARIEFLDRTWFVPVPDVWILSTRSGCDKTNLNPHTDLVRMGLSQGRIIVDTPKGTREFEGRPSYDTLVMLAHATGNAIAASLLLGLEHRSSFPRTLMQSGLSISHWHGYPVNNLAPPGYALHGAGNPPVSCSTPQSAIYAFAGKLGALEQAVRDNEDYQGDMHVEPHHGTNLTGCMSLTETALWVDRRCRE